MPSFLKDLHRLFGRPPEAAAPGPGEALPLTGRRVRVPWGEAAFDLVLGRQRLRLLPEPGLVEDLLPAPPDLLLLAPERYPHGVGHFLRLAAGERLRLDPDGPGQGPLYDAPRDVGRGRVELVHEGEHLVVGTADPNRDATLVRRAEPPARDRWLERRRAALGRLHDVFGSEMAPLPPARALEVLRGVNDRTDDAAVRPRTPEGEPGAVLRLPPERRAILVGDLHGRIDNLLTLLSHNGYLEEIENGAASLVFLGDAVHPDSDSAPGAMDGSVLVMDLILSLVLRFPDRVHLLLGNHDSFSPEVRKGGEPQGLLWEKRVRSLRGDAYRDELERFYDRCPLVAVSDRLCACHGGPPRTRVTLDTLIDARRHPGMLHELLWTRQRTPGIPAGYGANDVRRFRNALGLGRDAPFVVGHFPRAAEQSVWLDVGGIRGHHVVYSAQSRETGLVTEVGGALQPHVYPVEPLAAWGGGEPV